jgi:excisionase family DNA binding protein
MFVSIHEAAKTLKVSERHLRRMMATGKYPYYRVGARALRLDLKEILALSRIASTWRHSSSNNEECTK